MKLLGNYCRNAGIRTSITVGVVGEQCLQVCVFGSGLHNVRTCSTNSSTVIAICRHSVGMYHARTTCQARPT